MTEPATRRRRRRAFVAVFAAATLFSSGVAVGVAALGVNVPFLAAVGQSPLEACDADDVDVDFTYGATRATGIRVTDVTVSGVSGDCATGRVEFVAADGTVVEAVFGTVTGGAFTAATTLWTDQFVDVRVGLLP